MDINNKYLKRKIIIKNCDNIISKFMGLMFRKNINYGLKIRCNGIHTFFMKENIDVILTDKNYNVLYIYKNVKPYRIIFPKKNVYYTYEFPKNSIK